MPSNSRLRLHPVRAQDEVAFAAAHAALFDYTFGLSEYTPDEPFSDYVARLGRERRGEDLPEGRVPATFLVAEVDGVLVGRSSIRHALNDYLAEVGGHVGYAVLPKYRRRGYATKILTDSLVIARAAGVNEVLVTCDVGNEASRRTIERCGVEPTVIVNTPEGPKQHFWFW